MRLCTRAQFGRWTFGFKGQLLVLYSYEQCDTRHESLHALLSFFVSDQQDWCVASKSTFLMRTTKFSEYHA